MKKSLYRILFFCILLIVGSSLAMELAPQQTNDITLIGPDGQKFIVPASFVQEAGMIKDFIAIAPEAKTREIPFRDINSNILKYVAAIALAADRHKDLKDRALLDAIEKEINIAQLPLIELLKAFDFFDYKVGIDLIARAIAKNYDVRNKFLAIQGFDHLKQNIARFYYLIHKTNLPEVDSMSYGFSIQDYLDYLPNILTTRIDGQKAKFDQLRINNLYGLAKLPNKDKLQQLDLDHNQIKEIPANVWQGFDQLKVLDLSYNKIRNFPANAWQGLSQLIDLVLIDNQITEIPANAWKGLTQLQYLNLGGNQISEIPTNAWHGLAQLTNLVLKNNQIREMPANAWQWIGQLVSLNLDQNQIREIPANAWQGLAQLQYLYLSRNQIKEIPANAWQGIVQLRGLNLDYNQIKKIPANAWQGIGQLQGLGLSGNQISEIAANAWQGIDQLQKLYLGENPISDADKIIIRSALPNVDIYF